MIKVYRIATPDADEYRKGLFIVKDDLVIDYITTNSDARFHLNRNWNSVEMDFISMWKMPSSKVNDNVYPTIEEL